MRCEDCRTQITLWKRLRQGSLVRFGCPECSAAYEIQIPAVLILGTTVGVTVFMLVTANMFFMSESYLEQATRPGSSSWLYQVLYILAMSLTIVVAQYVLINNYGTLTRTDITIEVDDDATDDGVDV